MTYFMWLGAEAECPKLRAKVDEWLGRAPVAVPPPVVDSTDPQSEYE